MDTKSAIVRKQEALISELKDQNKEQNVLIQIQEEEIDSLKKLVKQQEEKIAILTDELNQTVQVAKEISVIMDSIIPKETM